MTLLNSRSGRRFYKNAFLTLVLIYILLHLLSLGRHPFVHSDEAWLAVLTRAMLVGKSPVAVEEVFRLTPRFPHVIKTLYHIIQAPFLAVSWSVFSARLPSLLAALYLLVITTFLAGLYIPGRSTRFIPACLMAWDPQFWYISHFGRQEMILTALFLTSWYLKKSKRKIWISALPLVCGIFVHPNAFIIAVPIGALFISDILFSGKSRYRAVGRLLLFSAILAAGAASAIGVSFLMDPDFLRHYSDFGNSVGAGDTITIKLLGLPRFLGKMWMRSAGTYYLADIRPMFVIGIISIAAACFQLFLRRLRFRHSSFEFLLVLMSLAAGFVIVGKYSPPSITFLMPAIYLMFGIAIDRLPAAKSYRYLSLIILIGTGLSLIFSTSREIYTSFSQPSYRSYIEFLNDNVGDEGRVLANLNTAFAFEYDRMLIWRDLGTQSGNTMKSGLETVLDQYDVRWILNPDELEYIYGTRPVWNNLYGNPQWYPELPAVLEKRGTLIAEESFPVYCMRIVPLMGLRDWKLQVYRID